jgi:three-Cys-motif partner protein
MEDPVKPDDADNKWKGYHGHTQAKHRLLRYYLNPWLRKLSSSGDKLRIFDCFSGRGDYLGEKTADPLPLETIETKAEVPGSPQIILDRAVEHAELAEEIECVFIEKEEKNADILRTNLPPESDLSNSVSYDICVGKFQEETIQEVKKRGGWGLPTFFFIDPFGYSQLEYEVVTELARHDRCEVLINLMASEVIRWQDVEKHQDALKRPFGTSSWREKMEKFSSPHLDHDEVGYYCERLMQEGPDETVAYLVTEEDSKSMKYYLVFGTNHPSGLEIMREAMNQCGPGKFAYAPNDPKKSKDQAGLNQFGRNEVREKLKSLFSGRGLSFNALVEEYVQEETYSTYRRKDLRSELKKMENEGLIDVVRITSSTNRGLGGDDIIRFPDDSE